MMTFAPRAEALHAHSDSPTFNQEITAIWEVRHLLELGKAVLTSSDARHESRGSLKRLDFPERDDEHFLAHSMVNASGQISLAAGAHCEYAAKSPRILIPLGTAYAD